MNKPLYQSCIITMLKDGSQWETCTPLVKRPNGKFQSIMALHFDAHGTLLSMLVAEAPGVEVRVSEDLTYYWPLVRVDDDEETEEIIH